MKKLLLLSVVGLSIIGLFLAACSNEFEVTAPWKEVPVVYAIISPDDTAHYVRVEKAFLDPDKSALEIAKIPDSIYYPENAITVFLERDSDKKRFQMTRVDGAKEGYPRKDGIFATSPNWLYKVKPTSGQPVVEIGKKYNVVVKRADGQPDVTGSTTVPGDFYFNKPNQVQTPPLLGFKQEEPPTDIDWRSDVNAVFFNVYITVRYREEAPDGTVVAKNAVVWKAAVNVERKPTTFGGGSAYQGIVSLPGSAFFEFLAANIPPASGTFRYFENCDVTLEGGAADLKKFNEIASASGGITGAEVLPSYSNMSEGFGLFMSKNTTSLGNVRITPETVKEMNLLNLTKPLNFRT